MSDEAWKISSSGSLFHQPSPPLHLSYPPPPTPVLYTTGAYVGYGYVAVVGLLLVALLYCYWVKRQQTGIIALIKRKCIRNQKRGKTRLKSDRRFDFALFVYVMLYLVGSAVWLRLIPTGNTFGGGIIYPLWMDNEPKWYTKNYASTDTRKPKASGFEMTVSNSCNFTGEGDQRKGVPFCGPDNPQIIVNATVSQFEHVQQGLVVTVHSSTNFREWRQANTIVLPRDLVVPDSERPEDHVKSARLKSLNLTAPDPLNGNKAGTVTKACFGPPGFYYVVGCLLPYPGQCKGESCLSCKEPPCKKHFGPPFSTCLAVSTQCISTCNTGAVETRYESICDAQGRFHIGTLTAFSDLNRRLSTWFIFFIASYAFGVMYFFIQYVPGLGSSHADAPDYDGVALAARQQAEFGGSVLVVLPQSANRNGSHKRRRAHVRKVVKVTPEPRSPPSLAAAQENAPSAAKCGDSMQPLASGSAELGAATSLPTETEIETIVCPTDQIQVVPTALSTPPPSPPSARSEDTSTLLEQSYSSAQKNGAWMAKRKVGVVGTNQRRNIDPGCKLKANLLAEAKMYNETEAICDFLRDRAVRAQHRFSSSSRQESGLILNTVHQASHTHSQVSSERPQMLARGAFRNDANSLGSMNGLSAILFSISAAEGVNTIVRNTLGKIAANLKLASDFSHVNGWYVIDGFADEGHRIGAYYVYRAMCITFYQVMLPMNAMRLASAWLDSRKRPTSITRVSLAHGGTTHSQMPLPYK